jgi:hypothetical protein
MEQTPAFIVIVDISGYTGFVKMHRTSMVHAEQIVTDLMESVLDRQESPLELDMLQGDAAIFYARDNGEPGTAAAIVGQVTRFFEAFNATERDLVSCNVCLCDACNQIDGLRLKAILHHGELILKEVAGSRELGGTDIILAHRLLKNHVESDEYILMTNPFHDRSGDIEGLEPHRAREEFDLGPVDVVVFYPDPDTAPRPAPGWGSRLKQFARMEAMGFWRMLGGNSAQEFRNLPKG